MQDDDYSAAQTFFCNIITPQDVIQVKVLLNKISKAPTAAKRYLERRCRDAQELEEFFKDNDYLFYLENKRVALFDEQLKRVSEKTAEFLKQNLRRNGKPMHYMELKISSLEYAPSNVCRYIAQFYPGKEIKHFFKERPNIFVVHKDHTVFLVEVDSVAFFKRKLKAQKGQKEPMRSLKGRIGQAALHVQSYMNRNFNGDDFQDFLFQHDDVFSLDENGIVSLVSSE